MKGPLTSSDYNVDSSQPFEEIFFVTAGTLTSLMVAALLQEAYSWAPKVITIILIALLLTTLIGKVIAVWKSLQK